MDDRNNNFGALRLVLATRVLMVHAAIVLLQPGEAGALRRALEQGLSSGLSVYCFFLISGYLVTASYQRSATVADYVGKRIFRVVPGYLVAYAFSIIVAVLFGGAVLDSDEVRRAVLDALVLGEPVLDGVGDGAAPILPNVPMWTVAYEFRCYLLILLLGVVGWLNWRVMASIAVAGMIACLFLPPRDGDFHLLWLVTGNPHQTVRLVTLYAVGSLFYLCRRHVRYDGRLAFLALAAAGTVLTVAPDLKVHVISTLGAYVLFWMALDSSPSGCRAWGESRISPLGSTSSPGPSSVRSNGPFPKLRDGC